MVCWLMGHVKCFVISILLAGVDDFEYWLGIMDVSDLTVVNLIEIPVW